MKLLKITLITIVVATLSTISLYLFYPLDSERLLYIPSLNEKNFGEILKLQNIPLTKEELILLNDYKKIDSKWIRVDSKVSRYTLFNKILNSSGEKRRVMVMYGGDTIYNFFLKISRQANLNSKRLIEIYQSLSKLREGGIVATKYMIPYNTTERATVSYMLYKSNTFFKNIANEYGVNFPSEEFKKRMIVASIIQKETHSLKEMPIVASVIYNRLKKNLRLQLDATLNYGKNVHKIVTPDMIRDDNSSFNTYKHKGLPPTPIGTFSKIALKSAFSPIKSDYLYFVKDKENHIFSKSYKVHKKYVKRYKKRVRKLRAKRLKEALREPIVIEFPSFIYKPNLLTNKLKLK